MTEPSQRDIYDRISSVDNKLTELSATVRVQLDHGARRMDELGAADTAMGVRVTALERAIWRGAGAAGAIGAAGGYFLSWLIARHP